MATDPSPDLALQPLGAKPRTVREMLTTFHLVFAAVDPYDRYSRLILPTAARILETFDQADCRTCWLVGGGENQTKSFLGPWATKMLTFCDPDFTAISGFGLQKLPALVHLGIDGTIINAAEGWNPPEWRKLTEELAKMMSWRAPVVPLPSDPAPFEGRLVK